MSTVTPVPESSCAMPRATEICTVFAIPQRTISVGISTDDSLETKTTRPQPRSRMPGA